MSQNINTLKIAQKYIKERVKEGNFVIDATMGRGNDTAFLCELVGDGGKVLAFDIQEEALESTRELLEKKSLQHRASLLLNSHSNMDQYAEKNTVDMIVFNFGYLPKGNHAIGTRADSSILAIEKGLDLLKVGGFMSLCLYYGGHSGFEEKEALMEYFKKIDSKKYTVIRVDFYNRPNNPPIFIAITKDQ